MEFIRQIKKLNIFNKKICIRKNKILRLNYILERMTCINNLKYKLILPRIVIRKKKRRNRNKLKREKVKRESMIERKRENWYRIAFGPNGLWTNAWTLFLVFSEMTVSLQCIWEAIDRSRASSWEQSGRHIAWITRDVVVSLPEVIYCASMSTITRSFSNQPIRRT